MADYDSHTRLHSAIIKACKKSGASFRTSALVTWQLKTIRQEIMQLRFFKPSVI
jgi:hypothetical protein